jgi:hypothetical protein
MKKYSTSRKRNTKNRRDTPILASANDDLRTAGLRVLAKLIAQDLRTRSLGHGCLQTDETFKAKGINVENLS